MAASFGKMPTMSVRRFTSAFSRSMGFVDAIWVRCVFGKSMKARTSSRGNGREDLTPQRSLRIDPAYGASSSAAANVVPLLLFR